MVLQNKKCYLSGPIQYDVAGHNWRVDVCRVLKEEFGIDLFDPFADPKQQWLPQLKEAQTARDYVKMAEISRQFVQKDLCMVDRSDFLIAFLPSKVPTTGTVHEIINASNAKKPTLLVTDQNDVSCLPLWYFGFIPYKHMFAGWENLYKYLREINEGKHRDDRRWNYVYGLI